MSTSKIVDTALARPLSRRQFFSLTAVVGSLTFLGQITVGNRVINAYADEVGGTHFSVYVLSAEEVPVIAFDMSDRQSPKVLPGFSVEASAWVMKPKEGSGEKELTAVTVHSESPTDEAGFTTLKIRNLTDEYEQKLPSYSCYASLLATKDGYQRFEASQTFLVSGVHATEDGIYPNTLIIPALPDTGAPYLSLLSFDGLDVQHSEQTGYIIESNDYLHTIDATIRNAGSKPWNIVLFADGKEIARTVTTAGEGNIATAQIKEAWLDGAHGVSVGTQLSLGWIQEGASEGFKTALQITFEKGIMLFKEGYAKDLTLSIGDALASTEEFASGKHSKEFPNKESGDKSWLGKTGRLAMGVLPLPVEIICEGDGTVIITATLIGMFFMKRRDRKNLLEDPAQRWKPLTPKQVNKVNSAEWSRFAEHCSELFDSSKGNWGTFGSALARATSITTVDVFVDVLVQGIGKTVPKKGAPKGSDDTSTTLDIAACSMGKVAAEWTLPFRIGPVPCYFGFDITASVMVKLIFGMQFDVVDSTIQRPTWSATDVPGLPASLFNLTFEVGLNAGVGAKNLISLGARGYGNMIVEYTTRKTEDTFASIVGSLGAGVQAVAQVLCFRVVIDICKCGPWKFLNKQWGENSLDGVLRENPFGLPYPVTDLSDMDFPAIEFSKSDMLAESDLAENCYLKTCARYLHDEEQDSWNWVEGCTVDDEWTVGAAESGHDQPSSASIASIIDPYDTANSPYNPLRGIKPSRQDLQRWSSFSDDRSCMESVFHRWDNGNGWVATWFRIDTVEIQAGTADASTAALAGPESEIQPFVYADDSDSEAPTCFYMAPNDDEHKQLSPANANSVVRTRLLWSVEVSPATFFVDNLVNVDCIPDRVNTWDADLDTTYLNTWMYIALTSFRRDPFEEKTWDEIFKTQFITLTARSITGQTFSSNFLHDDSLTRWNPRILIVQPKPNQSESEHGSTCSIYFYERPKDGGATTLGRGDYIEAADGKISTKVSTVSIPDCIANDLDKGTFYVNSCLCDASAQLTDHRSADDLQQRFIGWVKPKASNEDTAFAVFWHEDFPENAVVVDNVSSITPRPNFVDDPKLSFLFCRDQTEAGEKDIYMVTLDVSDRSITGPVKVATSTTTSFFTGTSTYLYAVRMMDGTLPNPEVQEDSDTVALSGTYGPFTSPQAAGQFGEAGASGTVTQYQILRAHWLSKYQCFSNFYPIGQLDKPIDGLTIVPFGPVIGGEEEHFVSKTITSSQDCTADFTSVTIPRVIGIQLEGVSPVTHFCLPGDPCAIDIKVSNTGNVPLKSFKYKVFAKDNDSELASLDAEATTLVDHLAKAKQESPDDYVQEVDENGNPTGNWVLKEMRELLPGTLMPGMTRTYRTSFTMPDGISGHVDFDTLVFVDSNDAGFGSDSINDADDADLASEDAYPDEFALTAQDLESAYLLSDPRSKDITLCSSSVKVGVDLNEYSAGSTVAWRLDDGGGGGGGGGGRTADTGDSDVPLLGAAGSAAVAALAAGVAWYEKRRAENE